MLSENASKYRRWSTPLVGAFWVLEEAIGDAKWTEIHVASLTEVKFP